MNDGKLTDVLVEDHVTGFIVWADPAMKDIISSVPGVVWCGAESTKYIVHLDPRYDVEWIRQEIIAQIKIGTEDTWQKNTTIQ